jgi:sugar lactone lactonase YvrE
LRWNNSGALYIADTGNNRIRKVTPDGVITTVAGTGTAGFTGDGGLATAAQLSGPVGIAVDGAGNLYIADYSNGRIRKVNVSGMIATVAGSGASPVSVALDRGGNLYIGDGLGIHRVSTAGIVTKVAGVVFSGGRGSYCQYGGDGGPAVSASVCGPYGLVLDAAGNLYIADRASNRIRMVAVDGTINTVAGTGQGTFAGDGGPASAANLNSPSGVAMDASGNLYVADTGNNRVRKIAANGVCTGWFR